MFEASLPLQVTKPSEEPPPTVRYSKEVVFRYPYIDHNRDLMGSYPDTK